MAKYQKTFRRNNRSQRRSRGFLAAGGLIDAQMRTNHAKRGFALARIKALWPEIVGAEIAAMCIPVNLSAARGPAGGLLRLGVSGPYAPQIQMMVPTICGKINSVMGQGTAGRIQLVQASPLDIADMRRSAPVVAKKKAVAPVPGPVAESLSRIGDDELRNALETLAQNVLSRQEDNQ